MKRGPLLLAAGLLVVAAGIWYGISRRTPHNASATVTSLLPDETLAFLHVPDVNRSLTEWRQTDLYKLIHDPAVEAFLERPMQKVPRAGSAREVVPEIEKLGACDAFVALTGWVADEPQIAAGLRFRGSEQNAGKVIERWRSLAGIQPAAATDRKVEHQQREIRVFGQGNSTVATVYAGEWFLAANNVELLKTLIDRADGRTRDVASTIQANADLAAVMKQMPLGYAAVAFARVEQLARIRETNSATTAPPSILRGARSAAAATVFERARVRDVLFVLAPEADPASDVARSGLSLATKDAFLFLASAFRLPDLAAANRRAPAGPAWLGVLRGFAASLAEKGVSPDAWNTAFSPEISVVGEWPENTRVPSLLAAWPVKDFGQAQQLVLLLATGENEQSKPWTQSEQDGVRYFSRAPENPLLPIAPTIGLNEKLLVAGLDRNAVQSAFARYGSASALASTNNYQIAEGSVPTGTRAFFYLDTALFYKRLDEAVRPMLIMSAAFMPSIAESVDLGRIPPVETVTQYLSPIAISRSYTAGGYLTEAAGPISLFQLVGAAIAVSEQSWIPKARTSAGNGDAASVAPAVQDPQAGSRVAAP